MTMYLRFHRLKSLGDLPMIESQRLETGLLMLIS